MGQRRLHNKKSFLLDLISRKILASYFKHKTDKRSISKLDFLVDHVGLKKKQFIYRYRKNTLFINTIIVTLYIIQLDISQQTMKVMTQFLVYCSTGRNSNAQLQNNYSCTMKQQQQLCFLCFDILLSLLVAWRNMACHMHKMKQLVNDLLVFGVGSLLSTESQKEKEF